MCGMIVLFLFLYSFDVFSGWDYDFMVKCILEEELTWTALLKEIYYTKDLYTFFIIIIVRVGHVLKVCYSLFVFLWCALGATANRALQKKKKRDTFFFI